jgi:hypothetical protein
MESRNTFKTMILYHRILFAYLKEIGINTNNCVDSAQNRDYWRVLVNAALNLRVP